MTIGDFFYAPAVLLQDSAYSYRVWITLIKLLYAPLRYLKTSKTSPYIHQGERLCGRLLPSVRRVSEKNSSRETVWKVLSGCSGGLRSALWRAKDTVRSCPTMNGVASVRICLVQQGKDALLGFTAYGRSLTPSSTS